MWKVVAQWVSTTIYWCHKCVEENKAEFMNHKRHVVCARLVCMDIKPFPQIQINHLLLLNNLPLVLHALFLYSETNFNQVQPLIQSVKNF